MTGNGIFIAIGIILFIPPAILAVWFFGLRPFVSRNGRTPVTAITWFFSMWADWTTAHEITKETGKTSWSARLFLGLWLLLVCMTVSLVVLSKKT
jgi:hypothetical protein